MCFSNFMNPTHATQARAAGGGGRRLARAWGIGVALTLAVGAGPSAAQPVQGPRPRLQVGPRPSRAPALTKVPRKRLRRPQLTGTAADRKLRRAAAQPPPAPPCSGIGHLQLRPGGLIPGEEASFEITVAGAHIGRMDAKVGAPQAAKGRRWIPLFGRARTTLLASAFKAMVARHQSQVEPARLYPYYVQADATYGDDPRWERVHFGPHKVDIQYLLKGQERRRSYTREARPMDIVSLAYSARRLRLWVGMKACQEVYGVRRLWRMDAEVVGTTRVSTLAGTQDAYEVKIRFVRMPTPGLRTQNPPRVDMVVFVSKDEHQMPLSFEATMSGVTARASLSRWKLPR